MWTLGWQETMVIFLLALVLFGPKKLPELGKNIAKGLAEFRRHSSELKSTFDREMANIERETAPIKEAAQEIQNTSYDYSSYENSYYDSGNDSGSNSNSTESSSPDTTVSASATQGAESTTAVAQIDAPAPSSADPADVTATAAVEATQAMPAAPQSPAPVEGPVARG